MELTSMVLKYHKVCRFPLHERMLSHLRTLQNSTGRKFLNRVAGLSL